MKKVFLFLFTLLLAVGIVACKDSDNAIASGDFKEPYEAYGLKKGEGGLSEALYYKPPKAIAFQPFLLQAFKPEGVALEIEEFALDKGDQATLSIDEEIVYSKDNNRMSTGYVTAEVEITFNPNKEGTLFQVNNEVASKMVHQRTGYPDRTQGEKSYQGETIYQIAQVDVPGFPSAEPYLIFVLGQKGQAGNAGLILCRITGVKR
ncbi:MAG: hypothetical protein PHT78_08715 [Desulfitobacteriaceae bacterium]|nr:hypothetical protein [Clostridia bacterium]MDD4753311.1 hypothetical protein [Desulfitobacteriaceae bacterium]